MRINVWSGVERTQRVCQVGHGDPLELVAAQRVEAEERYYFHIRSKGCEGWVPESFVSPNPEAAVGDRM